MGKFQDLSGQKFGRWTVINKCRTEENGTVKWNCVCDCGNFGVVAGRHLKSSNSTSCGCYKREVLSRRYCKDETGNVYGNITVLKRYGVDSDLGANWLVRCTCGKEYVLSGKKLRSSRPTKCKECSEKKYWEKEDYDITGNKYGLLTANCLIEDNEGNRCWVCSCDCGGTAVVKEDLLRYKKVFSCGCLKSKAESEFKTILRNNNVLFIPQKTFSGCKNKIKLRFDIYIPNLNLCVELDGVQHFKPIDFFGGIKHLLETQARDQIKNKYCLDNNINILRIPYTEFKHLEEICIENNIIKGELNART